MHGHCADTTGPADYGRENHRAVGADTLAPAVGNRITYDEEVKGFGVRITSAGAKAFILNYRAAGRERRITIGSFRTGVRRMPGMRRGG